MLISCYGFYENSMMWFISILRISIPKNHHSPAFGEFCMASKIIALPFSPYSSRLTQPLDVGCLSFWKEYGLQIEHFIKSQVNHIIKVEFSSRLTKPVMRLSQAKT